MLTGHLGQGLEVLPGVHHASGVTRRIDNDQFCAIRNVLANALHRQAKTRVAVDKDTPPTKQVDNVLVDHKIGVRQYDFIAWIDQGHKGQE